MTENVENSKNLTGKLLDFFSSKKVKTLSQLLLVFAFIIR